MKNPPLVIEFKNGHYSCYSLNTPPTQRDIWLVTLLDVVDGVSDNVREGRWYFNATLRSFGQLELALQPAD